ncbi:MAG TPA: hypothetical protein VIL01_05300 [Thermomicrobiales bacterium]
MSPLLRRGKHPGQPWWHGRPRPRPKNLSDAWRFTLKGSPRHYDDVRKIIDADPGARVYFGEALTYERGAGVALWRVEATSFDWLPRLYEWWAEQERIEPIRFTFHLYFPDNLKYPALDLRDRTPEEVAEFIKERAPRGAAEATALARRM